MLVNFFDHANAIRPIAGFLHSFDNEFWRDQWGPWFDARRLRWRGRTLYLASIRAFGGCCAHAGVSGAHAAERQGNRLTLTLARRHATVPVQSREASGWRGIRSQ